MTDHSDGDKAGAAREKFDLQFDKDWDGDRYMASADPASNEWTVERIEGFPDSCERRHGLSRVVGVALCT